MTKLRDSSTAQGAFGNSVFRLGEDPEHGDGGLDRAARVLGKHPQTIYKWLNPEGNGPPVTIAELIDDLHRADPESGVEFNFLAWQERRADKMAGAGPGSSPHPAKLVESAIANICDATKALMAGRGDCDPGDLMLVASDLSDAMKAFWSAAFGQHQIREKRRNRRREDRLDPKTLIARPRLISGEGR